MWYNTMKKALLPLARALVQTEVFQKNPHLTLYCGVPLESVVTKEHPGPESQRFDYLLCDRNVPVLTATLVPWDEECPEHCQSGSEHFPCLPGIPSLIFSGADPEQAQLAIAEAVNNAKGPSELRFIGQAASPQLEQDLAAAKMLRYVQPQEKKEPTQYGWECGLMLGLSARGDHTYECRTYYTALHRVMCRQYGRTGEDALRWKETIPLEQCLSRLRQGLPSDSAYSALQVQKMADMPLDLYLRDFPEELAELRRALPGLEKDAVYRDAAALIHRKSEQDAGEAGLSTEYSWCTQILAKPLLRVCQEIRNGR